MKTLRNDRDDLNRSRRLVRAGAGALILSPLFLLAACGGSSSDDSPAAAPAPQPAPAPAPAATGFSKSATWTATLPAAGQSVCYDFDAAAEVAGCAGTAWDVKLVSQGRAASFATNSGPNGTGRGAAFGGPFEHTWAQLLTWPNANTDPASGRQVPSNVYTADSARNAFTGTNPIGSAAFEYSLRARFAGTLGRGERLRPDASVRDPLCGSGQQRKPPDLDDRVRRPAGTVSRRRWSERASLRARSRRQMRFT